MDELLLLSEFDFENLFALTGRDAGFVKMLLFQFYSGHEHLLQEIRDKLQAEDYVGARQRIHRLRGGAGNLGAMRLYEDATVLEEEIHKTGTYRAESLSRFAESFEKVLLEISTLTPL